MLTYFQNSFAIRLDPKFAKNLLLSIPPHFEHATTVPCEMSVQKIAIIVNAVKQTTTQDSAI